MTSSISPRIEIRRLKNGGWLARPTGAAGWLKEVGDLLGEQQFSLLGHAEAVLGSTVKQANLVAAAEDRLNVDPLARFAG